MQSRQSSWLDGTVPRKRLPKPPAGAGRQISAICRWATNSSLAAGFTNQPLTGPVCCPAGRSRPAPGAIGAGAYGTEENLALGRRKTICRLAQDKAGRAKFGEDPERACFTCSQEQPLTFDQVAVRKTPHGYAVHSRRDLWLQCQDCLCKNQCTRRQSNLRWNCWRWKAQARRLLTSAKGVKWRSRRAGEVQGVFGHIKDKRNFCRCRLRGLKIVRTVLGLRSLARNFSKGAAA